MRSVVAALLLAVAAVARAGGMLAVGQPFPAWSLPDQTGATVTSQSLAGKSYLLWFFPKAQTPGCTLEGQRLRDRMEDFRARGVEVLGVSFDPPAANAAFVAAEQFPFRLLSDQQRTLAMQVGAADDASATVARRVSYLVGPDGTVRKAYATVVPAGHAAEVLQDLGAFPQ
jgi:peroxiredoxin Q/BCP